MKKTLQNEIELHKKLSEVYDYRYETEFSKLYLGYWNEAMSEYLPLGRKLMVLECGCGTGPYLKDLIKRYDRVVGTDLSLEMLKRIDMVGKNIEITVGDAENLHFKNNTFDVVVCRETLHHLSNPQEALCEISRVLKPGATVVLSETCNDSILLRLPRVILYKLSSKFSDNHKAFYSKQLKDYCKNANLAFEKSRYLGYVGLPLCIMPDFLPLLRYLPCQRFITRALIGLDKFLAKLPIIRRQAFDIIIKLKKV